MKKIIISIFSFVLLFLFVFCEYYSIKGYNVIAKFENSNGISPGSSVKIAGVRIGNVEKVELDLKTFEAVVLMKIQKDIKIPANSQIEVISENLLGKKYLSITPSFEIEYMKHNDYFNQTVSTFNIENLFQSLMTKNSQE